MDIIFGQNNKLELTASWVLKIVNLKNRQEKV